MGQRGREGHLFLFPGKGIGPQPKGEKEGDERSGVHVHEGKELGGEKGCHYPPCRQRNPAG